MLDEVLAVLKGPAGFTRVVCNPADAIIGPGMHMIHATRPSE